MKTEKRFEKKLANLDEVFRFLEAFIEAHQLNDDVAFRIKIAVEEIFTNMVKYEARESDSVLLRLEKSANKLLISFYESQVDRFDITRTETYDIRKQLEKRPVGRLGLHLVKKVTDGIQYQYANRESQIHLTFRTEKNHV